MQKFISLFLLFFATLGAEEPPAGDYSQFQPLVVIVVGIVFMYFILWRPEQKRRKAMQEQRDGLKVGDEVIAVGIVGTVDKIEEEHVILKMVDGSKIKFVKAAITEFVNQTSKSSV